MKQSARRKRLISIAMTALLILSSGPFYSGTANAAVSVPAESSYLINDNFENSPLGVVPTGYTAPFGSGVISDFSSSNNTTVINNNNLKNIYNNTSASITGNTTNVLWINDGAGRGGFNKAFTPVTAASKKGITAQLRFMQSKKVGDSYVLELLDSNKKAALSFNVNSSPVSITDNTWYTVKYVADVNANTADLFINGKYYGNLKFATPVTDIASINFRMAGSSTGNAYVDDIVVYRQEVTTPQNLTAEGANQRVELNWNAASGADSYNVYRSDSPDGTYVKVAEGVTSNSYSDTAGLVNNTYYYYKVTAVGADGESDYSNYAEAYPNNKEPPSAEITGLKAIVRDGQLTITWNPVDEATFYTLERGTTPEGPFVPLLVNGKPKITDTSYLDTNLRSDTEYYYRLTAGNVGGMGSQALLEKVSPAAPLGAPILISAEPGNNKVDLNWTSVTKATYYTVSRSTVNGGPYDFLGNVEGTSFSDTTAVNGTTYYYVITAANNVQSSMISNQQKAKPYAPVAGAPIKPTGFKAIANDGSVSLSWNAVSGATSYNVKRARASEGPYTTIASTNKTSFDDSGVTNGTTYYYVVSAVNANGESPDTDELIVLPAKVLTVDKNATADGVKVFNTVQSAIDKIPTNNTERTIIYITPGIYTEKIKINSPYISLVGAGMDVTTIVYGDYAGTSSTQGKPGYTGNTFLSQTVDVNADYFTAANLTIENSAGPRSDVAQAVALSLKSDMAVFESVKLKGYQDTLYNGLNPSNKGRHYFHNSIIQGDVDFIFGEAPAVVMDNVKLVLVSNASSASTGGGHITAGAQKNTTDKGYVFLNSQVVDDPSAKGTYDLGRGWKDYARVSFINTLIDSNNFLPAGWATSCAGTCKTNYFSEYNSYGPGANAAARQISTQLTGQEASVTIPQIFNGWDPSIPVIMPKVNYMPEVLVTSSSFDKNKENQADIHVTVENNGYALTSITNGSTVLGPSDYTVTGNVYTIKKAYLAGLPEGSTKLSFNFGSISIPLTVSVKDTSGSDIGKQVLAVNDGWGSFGTGTTGGAAADPSKIYTVTKRSELIQALGGNNSTNGSNSTPKIIYIKGTIDMNVDDNDNPVGMEYYKDPAYDFNAYLAAYAPEVWGRTSVPSGPLETARANSENNQGNRIKINVGSNTTIVGLPGSNAKIIGGNLVLQNVDNVIIRNIEFQNAFDYFPQWDPTDGDSGNWNSAFDNISIKGSTHVWIDHNTFSDGSNPDDYSVQYFGRQYQQHDGALDITNASDLITVSYNYFHDHDKTTLVGGSDSYTADAGKERITFHHNYYKNVTQRVPRVRYGQVHVYNNYYEGTMNNPSYPFLYTIGVGYASQVYAQNNYFVEDAWTPASALIQVSGGTSFTDTGSILNGEPVNIAASNSALSPVSWTPTLFTSMDATTDVPRIVKTQAGAENTLPVLSAPTGLTATAGDSYADLTWNTVTDATYYTVKRSTTGTGMFETIASKVTGTNYRDANVTNGTTYYYVVTAANIAGESAYSNIVSAQPLAVVQQPRPPAAPTGLTATAGDSVVNLTWNAVAGATSYKVKRSTTSGGNYTLIADNLNAISYADTTVSNGTTYYYVVTAVNEAGESAYSSQVSAYPHTWSRDRDSGSGSAPSSTPASPSTPAPASAPAPANTQTGTVNVVTAVVNTPVPVKEQAADGKTVLKVIVDESSMQKAIDSIKSAANAFTQQAIIVEVKGTEPICQVQLPAAAVVNAQSQTPTAQLSVKYDTVTYDLPVKAIDVNAVAKSLGADSKNVKVTITIEKVSGAAADAIATAAAQMGLKPLDAAVDFSVRGEYDGKSVGINDFGKTYVPRTITVAKPLDPNKVMAVMYNPAAGTMSFVPATFQVAVNKLLVTIKRPGNSIYAVVETTGKSFADLSGHWAKADIELLASKLIVNGTSDNSFSPENAVTRGQFAALLVRALGLNETKTVAYADITGSEWYAGAVGAAAKAGIIEGFEDGTFRAQTTISREQMAVMIARAMALAGKTSSADAKNLTSFSDSQTISDWAKDAVAQAVSAGIVNGMADQTFQPKQQASRAEAAVMLKRLLQAVQFMN